MVKLLYMNEPVTGSQTDSRQMQYNDTNVSDALDSLNQNITNIETITDVDLTVNSGWTVIGKSIKKKGKHIVVNLMVKYSSAQAYPTNLVCGTLSVKPNVAMGGACETEDSVGVGAFYFNANGVLFLRPITHSASRFNLSFEYFTN